MMERLIDFFLQLLIIFAINYNVNTFSFLFQKIFSLQFLAERKTFYEGEMKRKRMKRGRKRGRDRKRRERERGEREWREREREKSFTCSKVRKFFKIFLLLKEVSSCLKEQPVIVHVCQRDGRAFSLSHFLFFSFSLFHSLSWRLEKKAREKEIGRG